MIDGMHGLGDNLYQRAVLRAYHPGRDTYLVTSWPQLYADLPHVRPVRHPNVRLRTQAKNAAMHGHRWHVPPPGAERVRWHYVHQGGTILESLCAGLGVAPAALDMQGPAVPPPAGLPERYAVIRPATLRTEWRADSRNPRPEYLALAAEAARAAGYAVISVADLKAGEEWALDPLPAADVRYHAGELGLLDMLGLVAGASVVIGGVGWVVPAAIAYRRRMLLIYGGWGFHNGPQRIFDPRLDTSAITGLMPDPLCMCTTSAHACNKTVPDVEAKIARFFAR